MFWAVSVGSQRLERLGESSERDAASAHALDGARWRQSFVTSYDEAGCDTMPSIGRTVFPRGSTAFPASRMLGSGAERAAERDAAHHGAR